MQPAHFAAWVAGLTALLLALVAAMNFLVNPYGQYPISLVRPVVQLSRREKVQLLKNRPQRPAGLVLGSSRVLKLEPDYLRQKTGYSFFNAGVNYGRVEDYLALLRLYRDWFGVWPRMVVVGMDEIGFADQVPIDARLVNEPELARQIPEIISRRDRGKRWCELISWQQTRWSFGSLTCALSKSSRAPADVFQHDGLIVYLQREHRRNEGTYDFQTALEYNQREYRQLMQGYDRLSPRRCQWFEQLAATCREHHIRLVVFLTPLHPRLRDYLAARTHYQARKDELVEFLAHQAAKHTFSFLDLADPAQFGGRADEFVDGVHPLEPNTRRMIDRVCAAQPLEPLEVTRNVSTQPAAIPPDDR